MKYGNIICDPNSEEAKKLIGKKIFGGYNYVDTIGGIGEVVTLDSINSSYQSPFLGYSSDGNPFTYTFIREVIEEPPTYRPYNDCEEMVDDFCERFGRLKRDTTMPFIWVIGKETPNTFLVEAFITRAVKLGGNTFPFESLFNKFTYLDGTPVGKEVQE